MHNYFGNTTYDSLKYKMGNSIFIQSTCLVNLPELKGLKGQIMNTYEP